MFYWLSGVARVGADVVRREVKRLALMIVFLILAAFSVVVALGFFLAGITIAIAQSLGPIAACFILFGGLLVVALIFFLLANAGGRRRRRRRGEIDEELALREERSSVADVAAAFAYGLARGFAKRRKG